MIAGNGMPLIEIGLFACSTNVSNDENLFAVIKINENKMTAENESAKVQKYLKKIEFTIFLLSIVVVSLKLTILLEMNAFGKSKIARELKFSFFSLCQVL